MFKSKLHRLCQQRRWGAPKYSTVKEGLDHQPVFSASVKVKDEAFQIPAKCRSSKEAQNAVAQVAFEHFTVLAPIPHPLSPCVTPAIQESAISEVFPVSSPQPSLPLSQCVTLATQVEVSPVSPPQSLLQVPLCDCRASWLETCNPYQTCSVCTHFQQTYAFKLKDQNAITISDEFNKKCIKNARGSSSRPIIEVSPVIQEAAISQVSSPHSSPLVSQCVSRPNQGAQVPEVSPMQISPCGILAVDNNAKMEPANREALQKTYEDSQQVHIVYRMPAVPANVQDANDKGVLAADGDANIESADIEVLQQNDEDAEQVPMVYRMSLGDVNYKDTLHLCKCRLRQYAEKKGLGLPMYSYVKEGPHHAPLFKSKVNLDELSYETMESFSTHKEADQAVSMVACQNLGVDVPQEDIVFYKTFLYNYATKKCLPWPSYMTSNLGTVHEYPFVCTVEIGSDSFKGEVAKSKKQAELNAAKVAYCALSEKSSGVPSGSESLTQNTLDAAKNKYYKDSDEEETEKSAKRAKSSPTTNAINTISDCSMVDVGEPISEQSSSQTKVVSPKILHLPSGNNPYVTQRSENLWLAYKREMNGESII